MNKPLECVDARARRNLVSRDGYRAIGGCEAREECAGRSHAKRLVNHCVEVRKSRQNRWKVS